MSSSATKSPIAARSESGVLIITIDREEAGNSLSLDTIVAIRETISAAGASSGLRGIVITGAGIASSVAAATSRRIDRSQPRKISLERSARRVIF